MPTSRITLLVELEGSAPPIVRELQGDGDLSLAELHGALQIAFGWREQHGHVFRDSEFPRRDSRYWGEQYQLADLNLDNLHAESEVSVAEAVTGGTLWYDYDFGDDWTHRITASAPATAIGDHRPVTLIGGRGRGPIEDSGGTSGYIEKLAILADPDHPDHEWIAEWAADVAGPWFPPTPDSFDVPSIQAELDCYFGYRADERDPLDMSGLIVADDLRTANDLRPDALLADFAAGLPSAARSEFRQYARRSGLLDPVVVMPKVRAQLTAPYAALLDSVGPDGVPLSDVDQTAPAALVSAATRLGLVRSLHGRLVRTGHGKRAAASTAELWDALTSRILLKLSPGAQVAGTALLLSYSTEPAGDSWRDIAFVLHTCGWAPGGDEWAHFDAERINSIVAPVRTVVESLGIADGHVADFARAALHGPAAIRSGTTTRYR